MKKTIALWLALALMLTPIFAMATAQEQPTESPQAKQPDLLEAFAAAGLDLTPYRGKAIFLNFFTEWCPFCMKEMGDIKKVFETYSQDELQIVLLHVWDGEDASNTENVKKTHGLEALTFFEDENRTIATLVQVPGYPTSLFIDKEGRLHTALAQAMTFEEMSKIVQEMGVALAAPAQAPAPDTAASSFAQPSTGITQ